jgi:hypothetical protein
VKSAGRILEMRPAINLSYKPTDERKTTVRTRTMLAAALISALAFTSVRAADIPPQITTPDKVETRIGTLEFKDGAPSAATVDKIYDNLDFKQESQ